MKFNDTLPLNLNKTKTEAYKNPNKLNRQFGWFNWVKLKEDIKCMFFLKIEHEFLEIITFFLIYCVNWLRLEKFF